MEEIKKHIIETEPCIADILIRKNVKGLEEVAVCVTTVDGTKEEKIIGEDLENTYKIEMQLGNVSNIKFGGTDNWGYNKLAINLGYTAGSYEADLVCVDNISVDEYAGEGNWCRCVKSGTNQIMYTALTSNPTNKERVAYFKHHTTDTIIKRGENVGRTPLSSWYVTVIQAANPSGTNSGDSDDEGGRTKPIDPVDPTGPILKIGLFSDVHMNIEDSNNSEYEEDLRNALTYFKAQNTDFVASCGDFCQNKDKDYESFRNVYGSYSNSLKLYTCMGNHDYQRIYQVRDDKHAVSGYDSAEAIWEQNIAKYAGSDIKLNYFDSSTTKGRLNYWFEKENCVFVFMSLDYGKSEVYADVIRGINKLDYTNQAVINMTSYVSDTNYDRTKETNFDYQYYKPEVLMWLKNILDTNTNKRVFVFSHHFLPHKAGDADYQYARLRIWPEYINEYNLSGSNTPSGLTFWFLNKLNNEYKNTVWFSGHSHRAWEDGVSVCNQDYNIITPTGSEQMPHAAGQWKDIYKDTVYDYKSYSRLSNTPTKGSAPWVGLPSLSKPDNGYYNGNIYYQASQGAILEIYEDEVVLKELSFKKNDASTYENKIVKEVELTPGTDSKEDGEYIEFVLKNDTNKTVRFSNKFNMMVTQSSNTAWSSDGKAEKEFPTHIGIYDSAEGGWAHWWTNPNILKPGETKTVRLTEITRYNGTGVDGQVITTKEPLDTFCNGTWSFMTVDKYVSGNRTGVAIKLGVAVKNTKDGSVSNTAFSAFVKPLSQIDSKVQKGKTYHLSIYEFKESGSDWAVV